MKKPDITRAPWGIRSDEAQSCVYVGYFNKPDIEVVADIWGNKKEYMNNAKAISAVPDMIDALIEATNYVNSPSKSERVQKKIEKALTKAGVNFNGEEDE